MEEDPKAVRMSRFGDQLRTRSSAIKVLEAHQDIVEVASAAQRRRVLVLRIPALRRFHHLPPPSLRRVTQVRHDG